MSLLIPKYKFNQVRQIGEHEIHLPDPPNIKDIAYYNLPKDQQFFRRTYLPNDWKFLSSEDRSSFGRQEWSRRKNGFWFMNNGNLEYMTGTHYFYANWWKIGRAEVPKQYILDPRDFNFPFFVDSDRDWHYVADYVFDDPHCVGFFSIENRRGGKTSRVTSYQYEKVSKTANSQGGIQSRNDTDSKKIFGKLVYGWRSLPDFFKPTDTGDKNPATILRFDEPRGRDTKNQKKDYSETLHSWIDYENSKEGAYDGQEQLINIQDEIGKISSDSGVDLLERMRVVKECCMKGSSVVGKILATTTVEEMEKAGGKQAKELWNRSTILDSEASQLTQIYKSKKARDDNGFTVSGLYRYFKPGYMGLWGEDSDGTPFIDRYGYSQIDRARAYLDRRRSNKNGSDLSSEKRKYPIIIQDCWVSDSKKSVFDTTRIEQQIEHNQSIPLNILVRGNFMWKDGIKDSVVVWVPSPDGKWLVTWMPKTDERNKFNMTYGKRTPTNTDQGCLGLDPYDNKVTVDNRKSDAACYGFRKFDPMIPYESGIFISEYVNRPKLPEQMWEDMIMQSVFYGWEILVESNKIGTINYFRMRGYENYLMKRPKETKTDSSSNVRDDDDHGIPLSGEDARMSLVYATESHIASRVGLIEEEGKEPYYGKCYFDKLLNQWMDFDFDKKWTQFDCFVGAGLALVGSRKHIPKKINNDPIVLFQKYSNKGMTSSKLR